MYMMYIHFSNALKDFYYLSVLQLIDSSFTMTNIFENKFFH